MLCNQGKKTFFAFFCYLLLFVSVWAVEPVSATAIPAKYRADWNGQIDIPGMKLEIAIHITNVQQTIDIPLQKAYGLKLIKVNIKEEKCSFQIDGVPGEPTFVGTLVNSNTIKGSFTQNGSTFPFQVTKNDSIQSAQETQLKIDKINAITDSLMKLYHTPGVALVVVKGNEIVLSKGYGYRNIEKKLPVDNNTLFAIGSSTKAFTSTLIMQLVEAGKVSLNSPVKAYLPDFKLSDAYVTEQLSVEDLLTHRSGIPRNDLLWYVTDLSREELYHRLAYLPLTKPMRTTFQYNNLMYMTAGYLVGKMNASTWEETITKNLLVPLEMNSTNTDVIATQKTDDYATPYITADTTNQSCPWFVIKSCAPAGAINSNLTDMAKWLQFNINKGKYKDQQLLQESFFTQLISPQFAIEGMSTNPEISFTNYGLGWMLKWYRNHFEASHGGNIDGFTAEVAFYPNDQLGIVILTNQNESALTGTLKRFVCDVMFDLPYHDWAISAKQSSKENKEEPIAIDVDRVKGTKPSHDLAAYTGVYENQAYGDVEVSLTGKSLNYKYYKINGVLEHYHYDVFKLTGDKVNGFNMKLQFLYNQQGDIDRISTPMLEAGEEVVFTKKPDTASEDLLNALVGQYEISGMIITIEKKGDSTVTCTVPGQPVYTLLYKGNGKFDLQDIKGYSIKVNLSKGKVTDIVFMQPNGNFSAKKK